MTLFGPGPEGDVRGGAGSDRASRPESRAPGPNSVRISLVVAYDGTGFRGFAAQVGVPTVGGTLAQALQAVIGHPVEITCAGRTDAGVHARGQVVHFDLDRDRARDAYAGPDLDLEALRRSCNRMLAPAVVVRVATIAPPGFDARRRALWRRYRYLVLNREDPDPFLAAFSWHVDVPLDLRSMQLACDPLYGQHDFAAFCRRPNDGTSTVRRLMWAEWSASSAVPSGRLVPRPAGGPEAPAWDGLPELLVFDVTASAFCHQMVRSLVGTMVDVGRGRRKAGEMAGILRAGDRAGAGSPAPPRGLCLEEVGYPRELAVGAPASGLPVEAVAPTGPAFARDPG